MQQIGKALKNYVSGSSIEKGLEEQKAIGFWAHAVGKKIAEKTKVDHVENGILVVQVKTPAWRLELQMQKQKIIKSLNNKLTKTTIKDIRFI